MCLMTAADRPTSPWSRADSDAVFAVTAWAVSAVEQGTVRALAITGQERHPNLPDVPTLRSFGIESDTTLWAGLYAPKGASDALVTKIDGFVQEVIKDKTYKKMMKNLGNIIQYLGPEEFQKSILAADRSIEKIAVKVREEQK